jgi:hypothetical protein
MKREDAQVSFSDAQCEYFLLVCNFFLDTNFRRNYTFVNCKESLAGSKSIRQRENSNGNQKGSSKEASEEGSQEGRQEEVTRQRNRQHSRGTRKASPEVFLRRCANLQCSCRCKACAALHDERRQTPNGDFVSGSHSGWQHLSSIQKHPSRPLGNLLLGRHASHRRAFSYQSVISL